MHTRTAGNNIVAVFITLVHRQNRVRGHWRTDSINSGVEKYLRKQPDKTNTQGNKTEIRNQRANVPGTYLVDIMSCTSYNRTRGERTLPREKRHETNREDKMRNCETTVEKQKHQ